MNEGSTIYLVEDDKPLAESVRDYLASEGFEVRIIDNGTIAVDAITTGQPDLVILDIMLPGKDGLEICREIRPDYRGYVIMFTAREDEIDQILETYSQEDPIALKAELLEKQLLQIKEDGRYWRGASVQF